MPPIRNFSIIAHIDHGKTTLTDRFLEVTGAVSDRDRQDRVMDSNPIEKERGITIKLAPVTMTYRGVELNLIDTPGHVDFGYEVSRSLAACEGALLLIDATQGIQAQTLSNYEKAQELGLTIIPVLNKVDLPAADVEGVTLELMETLGFTEKELIKVSAKTGQNVPALLDAIIELVPEPQGHPDKPLRSLVFTSYYDQHLGVVAYVRVVDGVLQTDKLHLVATNTNVTPIEIGRFRPAMQPVKELTTGQVGYLATGLKDPSFLRVGDTLTLQSNRNQIQPLPGYKEPTPMVYMEIYPIDGDDYSLLQDAMEKLALHDSALAYKGVHSVALGNGLQVGFLGLLHGEIVRERLRREFDLELIATAPSVPYKILTNKGTVIDITSPANLPDPAVIREIREPMTNSTILVPKDYLGGVMQLAQDHRGSLQSMQDVGTRVKLDYQIPLAELITSFHDRLKSVSSGFASLEYKLSDYQAVDAVKVNVLVNKEQIEALSVIAVRDSAEYIGRALVKKLKEVIPRQLFEIPIQAAIGGKVIARETVKAYRKDVTAKLYGGDRTRRMKLLKKQAKGKKRMKSVGKVELNQEAFLAVLER